MKKLLSILSIMTLSVMLFAQAPQSFSYQTVIRDASWNVLNTQSVGIKISILEDVSNGTVVYEEFHSATTSQIGLVNLSVGDGTVMTGVFNTIDWGDHSYFIEVAVDVTGGTNYTVMGTTQLRSVPYALYAETSGTPGTPGPQGIAGVDGIDGSQGIQGTTGLAGAVGATGADGNDGAQGIQGTTGLAGAVGTPGIDGTNGLDGADGVGIAQTLTISVDTLFISSGNYIILPSSTQKFLGDLYQGGIIFYVFQPGDPGFVLGQFHGLIAATSDQSTNCVWGCNQYSSGANGTAIGTGAQNTITILTCPSSSVIAADVCVNLTIAGYSDWFLPSKDELNLMYVNLHQNGLGGFASPTSNDFYWSSTEDGTYGAEVQDFSGGTQFGQHKSNVNYVRAVRAF